MTLWQSQHTYMNWLKFPLFVLKWCQISLPEGMGTCPRMFLVFWSWWHTGPSKSNFDLLVHFWQKHLFTCPCDIYIVNSLKFPLVCTGCGTMGQPGQYGQINLPPLAYLYRFWSDTKLWPYYGRQILPLRGPWVKKHSLGTFFLWIGKKRYYFPLGVWPNIDYKVSQKKSLNDNWNRQFANDIPTRYLQKICIELFLVTSVVVYFFSISQRKL